MRLLLDTHIVLWAAGFERTLAPAVAAAIDGADAAYVSAASTWELAIKQALGQIELIAPLSDIVRTNNFDPLPVTLAHAEAVAGLPLHHRDPFDRLLIAQARIEGLTLLTADRKFAPYGGALLFA